MPMFKSCQPMDFNFVLTSPGRAAGVLDQTGYVLYAHTDSKGVDCPGPFDPHELWARPFKFTVSSR